MNKLSGKHVWLIGASEGIGRETALQLAKAGAVLCVSARQEDRLRSLIDELSGSGHTTITCDVTDLESVKAAWKTINNTAVPDIVIYNAGTYDPVSADKFDLDRVKKMVDINFTGALNVIAEVVPAFVSKRQGHIALVGSVAGYAGLPNSMGYGASKAALINLAEGLYCDLSEHNIKVQVINPGFVRTRLTEKNSFTMPGLIDAERAANHIVDGLARDRFEIRFPFLFTSFVKLMSLLPYGLYLPLARRLRS